MSNLKRYTNFVDEFGKTIVLESQVGEFVKFDDVKELLQTATNKQSTPCYCKNELAYTVQKVVQCGKCGKCWLE